ncbi:MAG: DUF433 domain-containing protein [Pirellulales bacterium]|nr:DUF433 domain-containing protein [Pirellulales bacterium]
MSVAIQTDPLQLREDSSGGLRIGQSRVLLELVLRAFQDGATPEAIVQRYPTLSLDQVYSVIAYYLQHHHEMERYLAGREEQAAEVQQRIEKEQGNLADLRRRLIAQRRS